MLKGCYSQTEVDIHGGFVGAIYTPTGEPDVGQLWMHSDGIENDVGDPQGVGACSYKESRVLAIVSLSERLWEILRSEISHES